MKTQHRLILAGVLILCLAAALLKYRRSVNSTVEGKPAVQSQPASTASLTSADNSGKTNVEALDAFNSATAEILALLASANPLDQSKVYRELLPALVRRDPRAAAAFAQSPAAAPWHDDLMVTVAQVWTDVNVDDAEGWAAQLPNLTERNMVLGYVCFEEANVDPARAVQVLDNPDVNSARREIIVENLAQQWATGDLTPLYDEMDKLPAGAERDGLYKRIALAQSQKNPQLAAQMVVDKIADGPIQIDAAMYVLRQWARQDMGGARDWVNNFPAGELHDKAMTVLAGNLYGAYQAP